jgi:hypothetical protein
MACGRSHDPFSDKAIWTALEQFRRSSIGYLLATTYPNARENTDIKFGQVRHINLCAPPFSLPPPLEILRETTIRSPVGSLPSGGDRTSNKFWKQRTLKSKGNKL